MRNPISLQIQRSDRFWSLVEVIPLLIERDGSFTGTGTYELYEIYPIRDNSLYDAAAMRQRYEENSALSGNDHPNFLGSIQFTGFAYFEWKYTGHQLTEPEVLQIVDHLQEHASVYNHTFRFGCDQVLYRIRIEEMEGRYLVFINDKVSAEIQFMEEDWQIISGNISDLALRKEVLRRINAIAG